MFSANSSKICCSFAKNIAFEKSKMAAKMADTFVFYSIIVETWLK